MIRQAASIDGFCLSGCFSTLLFVAWLRPDAPVVSAEFATGFSRQLATESEIVLRGGGERMASLPDPDETDEFDNTRHSHPHR
jgi:hypothetical protein